MAAGTNDKQERVVVRKLLPALPEAVFDAWTNGEQIRQWMAAVMTDPPQVRIDARPGGTFRIDMQYKDAALPHTGEYLEVQHPDRLVFTWNSRFTGGGSTVVEIILTEANGQTEFVLTHDGLPDEWVEAHRGGWAGFAEDLARWLRE